MATCTPPILRIVPWKDTEEWTQVYELLFESKSSTAHQKALALLSVWESRGRCPAAVEVT